MNAPFFSGFVSLVGAPNVGKSTLTNALVGKPVSITADKPQTTRNRIMGICNRDNAQMVLVDTPGIHTTSDTLNTRMVAYALAALEEADRVLMVAEPFTGSEPRPQTKGVLQRLKGNKITLALNKTDLFTAKEVLDGISWYHNTGLFDEIFPLSALKKKGTDALLENLLASLPEGPAFFEEDQFTDQGETRFMGEMVRQEIFRRLEKEVPYSTHVKVEHVEENKDLLSIYAKILVERDSQKGILIGKGGRMLKSLGTEARKKLEAFFGVKVFLSLQVSVLKDWSENPRHLSDLGYPKTK